MTAVQTYSYVRPSAVRGSGSGRALALETSGGSTPSGDVAHPVFFRGFLTAPIAAAAGVLAVAEVAQARYVRQDAARSRDPVVTANGDRLRVESFSGCGGVYARLDVLAPGLDGDEIGHGTTNVDVNPPLQRALATLGGLDPLHLAIGPDELAVRTFDGRFVEKRVPLPERWLRGFAEAQVLGAGFELRAEVPAAEAAALLRTLPRPNPSAGARDTRWVLPVGGALRPVTRPVPGAIPLPGPERLHAVRHVLPHAVALRAYSPAAEESTAVAWEVELPHLRLTLMLSPEPGRGFSGEGGVLDDLATGSAEADADLISALLAWEPTIDVPELARQADLPPERVRAALTVLGTSGQVGYDLAEQAYFHRCLPFSAGAVETRNPRLRRARALIAEGLVRRDREIFQVGTPARAQLVRADGAGALSCTCPWWARYRGGRGPCAHVLATRMFQEVAK
ncbi:SWIM zinc finger family protein [Saccharopolyspora gregorii]|uniref:SWIM zinc finger family protein n=1 Tax=Saccharopolyspora gregorii TaxID=33914 RepID=UPI0031E61243